jgi:hypothetical protein
MTAPCAAGPACRNVDPDTHKRTPGKAEWHRLCEACLDAGTRAVRALPLDWRDVEQLLPPSLGVWGDGQPGRGEPPAPIRLDVEALQRAVWWLLTAWEEIVRDVEQLPAEPWHRLASPLQHYSTWVRPPRPGPADVVRAAALLTPRVGALSDIGVRLFADYPIDDGKQAEAELEAHQVTRFRAVELARVDGAQGVLDLVRLHHRAQAMLGLTQPIRSLPGDCSRCGRAELRQRQPRRLGDEQPVFCGHCDRQWSYDEYARYAGLWEASAA